MHELGLTSQIYEVCRRSLAAHGGSELVAVRIAVGELAAVEPDLLTFAWEAITAEGPSADARLIIDWHPARQICPACDREIARETGSWKAACPHCEGPLEIRGGRELEVLDIQIRMPDSVESGCGR